MSNFSMSKKAAKSSKLVTSGISAENAEKIASDIFDGLLARATVTDDQIRDLRNQALDDNDLALSALCAAALGVDGGRMHVAQDEARARCADVICARSTSQARVRIGKRGKEQPARIVGVPSMSGHGCEVGVDLTVPNGALPDVRVAFATDDPNTAILARKLVKALNDAGIDWRGDAGHTEHDGAKRCDCDACRAQFPARAL